MKFNWRKWVSFWIVILLTVSTFGITSFSIYFFTKQQFSSNKIQNNLLPAPIFNQSEINQMTTPLGFKLDTLKKFIKQKTPATINHYYVNNKNSSWMINIVYSWENKIGNWIYELKYD